VWIRVGYRVLQLQKKLADRVKCFQDSLQHIKTLQGILLFVYCRKIRNDQNCREEVEEYVIKYSTADFTYSIRPKCYEQYIKPELEKF
jgi:hypothetical protein